jgi:hypothetical protein
MSKPISKSYITLNDKLLGSLLYLKDKNGKSYLKFSFKNKTKNLIKWSDTPTLLPAELQQEEEVSVDLSFKFEDKLLEYKRQIGEKITREFYKVNFPTDNLLFIAKLRDIHLLDDAPTKGDKIPLVIGDPTKTAFIYFSFTSDNGLPFTPGELLQIDGAEIKVIAADLPEKDFPYLCVGITEVPNDTEPYNLIIKIPYQKDVSMD